MNGEQSVGRGDGDNRRAASVAGSVRPTFITIVNCTRFYFEVIII